MTAKRTVYPFVCEGEVIEIWLNFLKYSYHWLLVMQGKAIYLSYK